MSNQLTDSQHDVLLIVMRSWAKRGKCPTTAETADRMQVKTGAIKFHMRNLVAAGYISDTTHKRVLRDPNGNELTMQCKFIPKHQKILDIDLAIKGGN